LLNIAPYLKESLFVEALEITKAIGDVQYRAKALQALISSLKSTKVDLILLKEILHVLGTLTRPHFLETLPNLVPLILHFGGIEALREVHQGIREVSRWWK
jgi:hypothetical protein